MSVKKFNTRIQLKNDTSTNWGSAAFNLLAGEFAWDSTNNNFKIGDGGHTFAALPYVIGAAVIADYDAAPSGVTLSAPVDNTDSLNIALAKLQSQITASVGDAITGVTMNGSSVTITNHIAQLGDQVTTFGDQNGAITLGGHLSMTGKELNTDATGTGNLATTGDITAAIEALDVNTAIQPVTYTAATSSAGASLTFAGMKETDGIITVGDGTATLQLAKVATSGAAADVSYSNTIGGTSVTNVDDALDALVSQSGSALQSISHGTDGSYVTTTIGTKDSNNNQSVGVAVTVQAVSSADSTHMGLAEASDVKSYVDGKINALDTTNDVPVATADTNAHTVTLNGSIKEVDGVIADGAAADVVLHFASEQSSTNKIITQNEIADLSGAMHFRSVITTSTGTDYVAAINSYYTTAGTTAEVGDVFVDSTSGKEYVVKSTASPLTASNIEEFGSVNPDTTVASITASTTTTGLVVTPTTATTGAVTVTVNTDNGYQIPTTTQMTKVDNITVNETSKSVTDGTNTLTNLVSDANYAHITVTSTSVSDGTTTFNKYVHPTTTAAFAAAVKVGNDSEGHVVLGAALTSSDIATVTGDPQDTQNPGTTVSDSLQYLQGQITANTPGTLTTTSASPLATASNEALTGNINLHKVAKTGTITDLYQAPAVSGNTGDLVIFDCGSASVNTNNVGA